MTTLPRASFGPRPLDAALTVKEPDDSMIEVAIEAMKAVIPEDGTDLQCPLQAKQPKEKTA